MRRRLPVVFLSVVICCRGIGMSLAAEDEAVSCDTGESPRPIMFADAIRESLKDEPQLLIARQELLESRSGVLTADAALLPSAEASLTNEKYVPNGVTQPVIVVGSTVLGGSQTKSGYGSLSLNWNLLNSGRDWAAIRAAQAGERAATSALDGQLADTFTTVLQAYAEVYEAQIAMGNQSVAARKLQDIVQRSEERYRSGQGTTLAIAQARSALLQGQETLYKACRTVSEKSAALAQAMGLQIDVADRLAVAELPPLPVMDADYAAAFNDAIDNAPEVVAAREQVAQAEAGVEQARRSFGPSVSLSMRKDYLGESADSFRLANDHIAPTGYRIGLSFVQPLMPYVSLAAAVDKARAESRKAQARYEKARLDTQSKLREALSARSEATASYAAARSSLEAMRQLVELTESQYRAGRADLDSVQRAQLDADKAETDMLTLASHRVVAEWLVVRAWQPGRFADLFLQRLQLGVGLQE